MEALSHNRGRERGNVGDNRFVARLILFPIYLLLAEALHLTFLPPRIGLLGISQCQLHCHHPGMDQPP
jgi:hypothetical protein